MQSELYLRMCCEKRLFDLLLEETNRGYHYGNQYTGLSNVLPVFNSYLNILEKVDGDNPYFKVNRNEKEDQSIMTWNRPLEFYVRSDWIFYPKLVNAGYEETGFKLQINIDLRDDNGGSYNKTIKCDCSVDDILDVIDQFFIDLDTNFLTKVCNECEHMEELSLEYINKNEYICSNCDALNEFDNELNKEEEND